MIFSVWTEWLALHTLNLIQRHSIQSIFFHSMHKTTVRQRFTYSQCCTWTHPCVASDRKLKDSSKLWINKSVRQKITIAQMFFFICVILTVLLLLVRETWKDHRAPPSFKKLWSKNEARKQVLYESMMKLKLQPWAVPQKTHLFFMIKYSFKLFLCKTGKHSMVAAISYSPATESQCPVFTVSVVSDQVMNLEIIYRLKQLLKLTLTCGVFHIKM